MAFRCNVVIHFFDNALKVAVKEESCEECGASQVEVGFKVNTAGSPDVCQGHSHHHSQSRINLCCTSLLCGCWAPCLLTPSYPFSPSLLSLMVSVAGEHHVYISLSLSVSMDVEHHVYFLCPFLWTLSTMFTFSLSLSLHFCGHRAPCLLTFSLCVPSLERTPCQTAKRSTLAAASVILCSNLSWRSTTPSIACPREAVGEVGGVAAEGGGADPEAEGGASPRTRWLSWQHTLFERWEQQDLQGFFPFWSASIIVFGYKLLTLTWPFLYFRPVSYSYSECMSLSFCIYLSSS